MVSYLILELTQVPIQPFPRFLSLLLRPGRASHRRRDRAIVHLKDRGVRPLRRKKERKNGVGTFAAGPARSYCNITRLRGDVARNYSNSRNGDGHKTCFELFAIISRRLARHLRTLRSSPRAAPTFPQGLKPEPLLLHLRHD